MKYGLVSGCVNSLRSSKNFLHPTHFFAQLYIRQNAPFSIHIPVTLRPSHITRMRASTLYIDHLFYWQMHRRNSLQFSGRKGTFCLWHMVCVRLFRPSETFHLASDTFFRADYKWPKIHLFFAEKPRKVFDARIQMSRGELTHCAHYFTCVFPSPRRKIETFRSAAYFEDKYCQLFAHASRES